MDRRRRIILLSAAAVVSAALSQPAAAIAAVDQSCTTPLYYYGGGPPDGAYTLLYECGEEYPGGGCYQHTNLQYYTFDCLTEQPGGSGCDGWGCYMTH